MTYEEIMSFVKVLLAIFTAIGVIGGGVAIIIKTLSPLIDTVKKSDFKALEKRVELVEGYCKNDKARISHVEDFDKVLCKALFAILDHELTGNSIDKLNKAKSALQDYIINET